MSTDTPDFWNNMWAYLEDCGSGSDEILADQITGLEPGRVLEIGCGTGGNAVWLAKQGWQVTAVDFSLVAVEQGKRVAAEQGVNVDFVVADASTYQPQRQFDLITSFYIQLFPAQRANMLSNMSNALVPGGTLLFVSHDKSNPPSGWTEQDILSLTTPEEIVAELSELQIEQAIVLRDETVSSHESQMPICDGDKAPHGAHHPHRSHTTIVRAIRPVN